MNLSSAAGDLVPVNHLIRFLEPMRKPTNEPTVEPTKQTTSKQGKYSLSEKQDAQLPSKITVSITQFTSGTSYTFEAVHDVIQVHVKYIVTGQVTIGDKRDSEIQSISPDLSLSRPNMIHAHEKNIVTKRVTFSDEQDNEIQSIHPDLSLPRPNEWQMPEQINLDSSGLQQST